MGEEKSDPKFDSAERLCALHWSEFLAEDPEMARIELRIAVAAKLITREYRGSQIHAEALKQWHFYREAKRELLEKRYAK
jgi:hypothetical protein